MKPLTQSLCAIALAAGTALSANAHAHRATGTVFHDINNNQRHDANEPGIAGVQVSNGIDIATTNAYGNYNLPITDDTTIFVIKPTGYRTQIDENLNIPRFYYIHKPNGSNDEGFLYEGVEPTGPLPSSVDFPLVKQDESGPFNVLLFGDPQPYTIEQVRYYATEVLGHAATVDAAFAISLGDLLGDDLDLFTPFNEAQAAVGIPFYNVYGNHDMNFMSPNDTDADETFTRIFGPANYAFQYGGVHFLILDNVYWLGFDGYKRDGQPWTGYARSNEAGFPNTRNYTGRLTEDQLAFIRNYLKHVPAGERIVLNTHIPLENDDPASVHQVPELHELLKMLSPYQYTTSFSGHTHLNRHWFLGENHGYTNTQGKYHHHYNVGTASGSWWRGGKQANGIPHATMYDGVPNGFAIATFEGSDINIRYIASGEAENHMRIIFPDQLSENDVVGQKLLTNVWGVTGSESTVSARIVSSAHEGPWMNLAFTPQVDPHYVAFRELEEGAANVTRSVPRALDSHNMFEGSITRPLAPGLYYIEVEGVDMFGNVVTGRKAFSVTEE